MREGDGEKDEGRQRRRRERKGKEGKDIVREEGWSKSRKNKKSAGGPEVFFYLSNSILSAVSSSQNTNLSSIVWIFERSSMAASESSEEGAGVDVGGEARKRRGVGDGDERWQRRRR